MTTGSPDGGPSRSDTRGRVLLVDDQPDLLAMLAEALSEAGFAVTTAINGRDALARLQTSDPEVVVADVEMPEMDGYELCRRVRAAGQADIPFLFCSGLGEPDDRLEGLQAGADDYIVKPPALDELVLKLTRQVGRVRRLRVAGAGSAPPSTRYRSPPSRPGCCDGRARSPASGGSRCAESWVAAPWARSSGPGT